MSKRSQQGFTITELVVVILVICLLFGLVLATRAGVASKERNTERQRDIAEMRASLEAYYAQHDQYPSFKEFNSVDWRQANMKGLDEEALRDPLHDGDYKLEAKISNTKYSYAVSAANGNECNGASVPCTQYTLSTKLEGNSGRFTKTNLN